MTLSKPSLDEQAMQFQTLAQQLPLLKFVLEEDCAWPQTEAVQTYLNFYEINFARNLRGVSHGFGCIDAAGFRIATHYWLPTQAKGTLVVIHGYYDHVGLFKHAIGFALKHNLAVLAFDLPGHGLSSGEPAAIDSFNQYADVLAILLQKSQELMPKPMHVLAQSTGCAVVLNYLWRYATEQNSLTYIDKIVLCAPLVLPRGWRIGRFIYAIARHFIRQLKRGGTNSSHDPHFNQFVMHEDPLQAKYLSLKWIGAMKAWDQQFCAFAPLQKELLIIQGSGDMTIDWHYNLPTIQRKLPKASVIMIANAGHQLVNENEEYRSQVFKSVADYLSH